MVAFDWRSLRNDSAQLVTYSLCVVSAFLIAWQVAGSVASPAAPPVASLAAPAPKGPWTVAQRSEGAFDLPARDLEGQPFAYVVRRHAEGGGRQDIMGWGDGQGAFLRMVVYRPGHEPGVPVTAFAAKAVLADAANVAVGQLRGDGRIATKFGDLPVANFEIAGRDGPRRCLAAGEMFAGSGIAIAAYACNAGPELVARGRLACWFDRLTLLSAGGNEQLSALFARAELHRADVCGETSVLLAPTRERRDWINARRDPPLRGRLAAR